MSEIIVEVDGIEVKVHPNDGSVFKVCPYSTSSTCEIGRIPKGTPPEQIQDAVHALFQHIHYECTHGSTSLQEKTPQKVVVLF